MAVTVAGLGADGFPTPETARAVLDAPVVVGSPRHLSLLPSVEAQQRIELPAPLRPGVRALLEEHDDIVFVVSGDPLLFGLASMLVEMGVPVTVRPAISSASLAAAAMGWPQPVPVLRDPATLPAHLAPGHRVLILSPDETTPALVAGMLSERGYGASTLTVLGNLGAGDESRHDARADEWGQSAADSPRLHVLAVQLHGPVQSRFGLPDDAFETDGQLSRRDVRISALARLAPSPGQVLWDLGAGTGTIGIEWLRLCPTASAVAVEQSADRAGRISRNATALGVPSLRVVTALLPAALADLPTPDAIFIGGGATAPGLLDACLASSASRIVVHGVTVETETLLAAAYAEHGGELTRLSVEYAERLGGFNGFAPARAVTQWSLTR